MSQKTRQGDIGVWTAILYYTRQPAITVSVPTTEQCRYDLVIDDGYRLMRVQVKTCTFKAKSGAYEVQLRTNGANYTTKYKCAKIDIGECDMVFILTGDGTAYEMPSRVLHGRSTVTMSGEYLEYKVGEFPPLAGVV